MTSDDFGPILICDVGPTSGGEEGQRSFPTDKLPSMTRFGILGVTVVAANVKYWIRAGAHPSKMAIITGVEGDLNTGGNAYEFDITLENIRIIRYLVPVPFVDVLADFKAGGGSLKVEFHRRMA